MPKYRMEVFASIRKTYEAEVEATDADEAMDKVYYDPEKYIVGDKSGLQDAGDFEIEDVCELEED